MIDTHGNYMVVSVTSNQAKLYINWCNINAYGEWMDLQGDNEVFILFNETSDYYAFLDNFRDQVR